MQRRLEIEDQLRSVLNLGPRPSDSVAQQTQLRSQAGVTVAQAVVPAQSPAPPNQPPIPMHSHPERSNPQSDQPQNAISVLEQSTRGLNDPAVLSASTPIASEHLLVDPAVVAAASKPPLSAGTVFSDLLPPTNLSSLPLIPGRTPEQEQALQRAMHRTEVVTHAAFRGSQVGGESEHTNACLMLPGRS